MVSHRPGNSTGVERVKPWQITQLNLEDSRSFWYIRIRRFGDEYMIVNRKLERHAFYRVKPLSGLERLRPDEEQELLREALAN